MAALLHLFEHDGARFPPLEAVRAEGVEIVARRAGETIEAAEPFDAVVISSDVSSPLAVARAIHRAVPEAHIVFVTTADNEPALRRQLTLAPRIGTHWSVARAEHPGSAAEVVRNAIETAERRRKMRTTLGAINTRLAAPPTASRRSIITDHLLATVLEQLTDAVVLLDRRGIVIAANASAATAFGERVRKGATFHDVARDAFRELVDEVSGDEARDLVVEDRESHAVYGLRLTIVRDEGGQPVATALVARDITARRRSETRRAFLAEVLQTLSSTLDVTTALESLTSLLVRDFADAAIVDIAEDGVMRRRSVSVRNDSRDLRNRFSRYAPRVDSSHPSAVVLRRGDAVVDNAVDETWWRSNSINEDHYQTFRDFGLHAALVVPLRAGDRLIGTLALGRGQSPSPFLEDEVEFGKEVARLTSVALQNIWAYHAAQEANRTKDEFVATISHELRTPMTAILGWVQMLRLGGNEQETVDDGLRAIEQSARMQAQLIDDLLDLSRIQTGKLHLLTRRTSLDAVIRAAAETVRPAADAKRIAIDISVREKVEVSADPNRLQQVVWNLLSNSVKFTEPGGLVRVVLNRDGSRAVIRVTDTGQGIDPEFLPHVFDRFRQADSATTRRHGGLGLGLSIVKQLVELHGGTVRAESRGTGHGAAFTITLPIPAIAAEDPAALIDQPGADAASQVHGLSGVRILLLEDDERSAEAVTMVLRRAGAEVEHAPSVALALEAVRARKPEIVVSDISLPDEDGYTFITQLRSTLRTAADQLPAIALTAHGGITERVRILGAGFQRCLTKPVDAAELTRTIAEVVGRA